MRLHIINIDFVTQTQENDYFLAGKREGLCTIKFVTNKWIVGK